MKVFAIDTAERTASKELKTAYEYQPAHRGKQLPIGIGALICIILLPSMFVGRTIASGQDVCATVSAIRVHAGFLRTGLRYITAYIPHATTVSICATVKLGAHNERGVMSPGVRYFLAQALLQGTRLYDADEFAIRLASIGATVQASVDMDWIDFRITSLPEHADTALQYLADILTRPVLDDEVVKRARIMTLRAQATAKRTPMTWAHQMLRELLYRHSPYARPPWGYPRTVSHIRKQHLYEFFDAYFRSSNVIISAAGAINPSEFAHQIAQAFRALPEDGAPRSKPPRYVRLLEPQYRIRQFYGEQAHILVAFPAVEITHPDANAVSVLAGVIGGGMGARLYQWLRERNSWIYTAEAAYSPHAACGELILHVATDRERIEACRIALEEMVRDLRKYPIQPQELQRAQRYIITSEELARQNPEYLAATLAHYEAWGIGYRAYLQMYRAVLSVTLEDVQRVAQRYLRSAVMVVLLPL